MSKDLVVKTNRLNQAFQMLTLAELHIVQLAIVDARETGTGLSTINHYALMLCVMPKFLTQHGKCLSTHEKR